MKTFFVATYRPPYPEKGSKFIVYEEENYCRDVLPSGTTAVFKVEAYGKRDAVARVLENAASPARLK